VSQGFYWKQWTANVTDERAVQLAEWRGYSALFVEWLRSEKLVGIFEGNSAFPNGNVNNGEVTSLHYRIVTKDGHVQWLFHPKGNKVQPFVLGDLQTAKCVHCFESQWDMFAVADQLKLYALNQAEPRPVQRPNEDPSGRSSKPKEAEQPKRQYSFNATYEPWDEPVDADALLYEIIDRIKQEVIVEEHQYQVGAIWTMFTWVHGQMEFSPLLYITPQRASAAKPVFWK
jgi:hypothetical protein